MYEATMSLSLLARYDDLIRCSNVLVEGACEPEFIQFAINQEQCRLLWEAAEKEVKRLKAELEAANSSRRSLEQKLDLARGYLETEKRARIAAQQECTALTKKLNVVRELLNSDNKINDETKEKLAFLTSGVSNTTFNNDRNSFGHNRESRLHTISEALNSTGSLLSELSYSKSEDDLEEAPPRQWRKHRSSVCPADPGSAKRRKSDSRNKILEVDTTNMKITDRLVATTTVTMSKEGPISASARIETHSNNEALPSNQKQEITRNYHDSAGVFGSGVPLKEIQPTAPIAESTDTDESVYGRPKATPIKEVCPAMSPFPFGMKNKMNVRNHAFCQKTIVYPENCEPCGNRIRFGKVALKCRDCKASCHPECKDKVPLPCVAVGNTPSQRGGQVGTLADYAPPTSPMVPSLIVHCVNEVDQRGLSEVGIYRVSGSEKDVKMLKEKFLRGKGTPNLSGIDIHVVCGTIKDFLRSLREPIVTPILRQDFIKATEARDPEDGKAVLYQAISELPQPNRDTLAFLMLHLQRVSACSECKMPASNLARIFGPTIIGYSCDPDPATMVEETRKQVAVVEQMLSISSDYWSNFVHTGLLTPSKERVPRTPSSSSLGRFFTPNTKRSKKGGRKYFPSPPA